MAGAGEEGIFAPWYEYLGRPHRRLLGGLTFCVGWCLGLAIAHPGVPLAAAVLIALSVLGATGVFVRWTVAEERTARLPTIEE